MSTPVNIIDQGTGAVVKVGLGGALTVGPPSASKTFNAELAIDATPVNIVPAQAGKTFCVTGLIITGDKNISTVDDAIVTIYEASDDATATSLVDIIIVPVARSSQTVITGILLETRVATYINGVTSDDNVFVTILGFYV